MMEQELVSDNIFYLGPMEKTLTSPMSPYTFPTGGEWCRGFPVRRDPQGAAYLLCHPTCRLRLRPDAHEGTSNRTTY